MDFSARAAKHGNKSSRIRAMERAGAVAGKLYAKPYHSQSADSISLAKQEIRYKAFIGSKKEPKRRKIEK